MRSGTRRGLRATVIELLRAHDVALVIADRPEIASFQLDELTAGFTFIRFHHGARGRRGNYSRAGSQRSGPAGSTAGADERDVYAYFNNDWEGLRRTANALRLRELLEGVPGRTAGVEREAAADRRMIDRLSVVLSSDAPDELGTA